MTSKVAGRYDSNDKILKGRIGDRVELICLIYASPPVNVSWYTHDTLIGTYIGETKESKSVIDYSYEVTSKYDDSKETSSTLVFSLDTDTFTSYHCQAENDIGSNRETVDIKQNTNT
jgi:hypothetical protein